MIVKVNEMLAMQHELDTAIMKEHGLKMINRTRLRFAIIDEIGELTHELKGDWCWWKKTQPPVDREKVLEEFVDVWHFAMCAHLTNSYRVERTYNLSTHMIIAGSIRGWSIPLIMSKIVVCDFHVLYYTLLLGEALGFTVDDIYDAYVKKNKTNYDRLKEGY